MDAGRASRQFLALGGLGPGVPVRATVSSFGPQLLAKVLGANETQSSSLSLVFHYADQAGLPLLDLDDLRAVLAYLTGDDGKAELKAIGGLSSATAGVLLRKIVELDQQGADAFFGEPELDIADLMRLHDADGKGVISCLELPAVAGQAEALLHLPHVAAGGPVRARCPRSATSTSPSSCFFFDEAHLLFEDAPEGVPRPGGADGAAHPLEGVGVFFVTQLPDDVPDEVLAQLGNRVQHALRAFTPRDAKALKAAVTTYPNTDDYDLEEDLTQLGTGEAMVTILSERGAPTPVVWTRLRPPTSLMAAMPTGEIEAAAKASPHWSRYAEEIDRESAREILQRQGGCHRGGGTPPAAGDAGPAARGQPRPPAPPEGAGEQRQRGRRLPQEPGGPQPGEHGHPGGLRSAQEAALARPASTAPSCPRRR